MEPTDSQNEKQQPKRNAFTVMKNVRDMCKQSDARKNLMYALATYSNPDGICYPGNRALVQATRKSERTVRRMLKALAADGELEVLTKGAGRDQKRIICLKRYVENRTTGEIKPDKALSPLNRTRPLGKTSQNNHRNCQTHPTDDTPNGVHTTRVTRVTCSSPVLAKDQQRKRRLGR
jgi:hypothetical protein